MSMALNEARQRAVDEMAEIVAVGKKRALSETESKRFDELETEVQNLDKRMAEAEALRSIRETSGTSNPALRSAAKPPTQPGYTVSTRSEFDDPGDYHGGADSPSFFRDWAMRDRGIADSETLARFDRHVNWATEKRSLSTASDGAGGYLVAPAYLQNQILELRVQSAPILGAITRMPIPNGGKTDSISIPSVTGGTSVSYATQNSTLPNADPTFGTVSATVFPFGGYTQLSGFLQRRSMPGADQIVMADLGRQLWKKIGAEVINGTGPSSAFEGILQSDSTGTATYTASTPTLAELWPKLLNAINDVATAHYSTVSYIVMHPRRWAWVLAQLDTSNRPFMEVYGGTGTNSMGTGAGPYSEGVAGNLLGCPVIVDNNIPTTLGSGTNEDAIIVGKLNEAYLFESAPMFAMDTSAAFASDAIQVRVVYDAAFTAERYPGAISLLTGTGLSSVV